MPGSSVTALLVDNAASITSQAGAATSSLSDLQLVTSLSKAGKNEIANSAASSASDHLLLASDSSDSKATGSFTESSALHTLKLNTGSSSGGAAASASASAKSSGFAVNAGSANTKTVWLVSSLLFVSLFMGTL